MPGGKRVAPGYALPCGRSTALRVAAKRGTKSGTRMTDGASTSDSPETPRISRATALVSIAIFLTLICLPGIYHALYGLRRSDVERWQRSFKTERPPEAIREVEADFNHTFLFADMARTFVAGVPVKVMQPVTEDDRAGAD